jgi:hypothetical protein
MQKMGGETLPRSAGRSRRGGTVSPTASRQGLNLSNAAQTSDPRYSRPAVCATAPAWFKGAMRCIGKMKILFEQNPKAVSLIGVISHNIERETMKRTIALLALIGLTGTALAAVESGKPAPDFTATDINGKTVKLSDYRGKIVVLESYNLDCPFCENHFKTGAMQELQQEVTSKGGIWLIVNSVNPKHSSYRTPEAAKRRGRPENQGDGLD